MVSFSERAQIFPLNGQPCDRDSGNLLKLSKLIIPEPKDVLKLVLLSNVFLVPKQSIASLNPIWKRRIKLMITWYYVFEEYIYFFGGKYVGNSAPKMKDFSQTFFERISKNKWTDKKPTRTGSKAKAFMPTMLF